jgi:hypothetical protein
MGDSKREAAMLERLVGLFILAGARAVSGCASMFTPAAEPKDGERARLRGVGGGFRVDQNVCGDRPDLSEGVFLDLNSPYWRRSLGMPRGMGRAPAWGEMHVRADQQIKVKASYSAGRSSCIIEVYFKPEKNRDYEFILSLSGFSQCNLVAADITDGDKKPVQISREKPPCR